MSIFQELQAPPSIPPHSTPPLRRHTPVCALHYWQTKHQWIVHWIPHQTDRGPEALRPSDLSTLPIRPAAGYVHSTLVLWPLPHQEQPACTAVSVKARENILSEFGSTTKAAAEITEARGEGASLETDSPYSLFLWRCDHREQILYQVLHGS